MNYSIANQDLRVIGIDLGKRSFHVYGNETPNHTGIDKQFSRKQLRTLLTMLPPSLIAMEACGSAHYWGRFAEEAGHTVRLIAPQFVKPYIKSNKNDRVDAQAIWEAVQRPNMRFVAAKTVEQQDIQSLHRIRSRAVTNRTALTNQIQGLLLEYGITTRKGRTALRSQIPEILEDAENALSMRFRHLLAELYEDLVQLDVRVKELDRQVDQLILSNKECQRLMGIPGIGPLGATALVAAIGDINAFKNGRELSAWLGLVPRQYSTGGKPRLLGISKRGDVYLRSILIHGARAALRVIDNKEDAKSRWAKKLIARRNKNVATVAMANKMVRTAYAMLKYGNDYRRPEALSAFS
jgi:transposase